MAGNFNELSQYETDDSLKFIMIYWILDIYFTHSAKRLLKIKEKKSKKKQKVLKVKFY